MEKILILDDEKDVVHVLEETLRYSDYIVKSISNSKNLYQLIEDFKPDLLLLDFLLLDENGGEICYKLKKNQATAHLPIILVSAFSNLAEMQSIYRCDAYIPKPFDIEPLLETITNCINDANNLKPEADQ
ncbi:MAG: hypothetical protein JWN56_1656 [Sphingobacteriales bacterium]|nr:hypothetical protein [Sphingobacteriales bacterium]